MKLAMILAAILALAFGSILGAFWALDYFLIGELERDSVPAGRLAIGMVAGALFILLRVCKPSLYDELDA
jgi:hypothetical protein